MSRQMPDVGGPLCAYVRTLPCLVSGCTNEAQAHHVKTRGAGGKDWNDGIGNVVPLCLNHHSELHTGGRHTFESNHRTMLSMVAVIIGAKFDAT